MKLVAYAPGPSLTQWPAVHTRLRPVVAATEVPEQT